MQIELVSWQLVRRMTMKLWIGKNYVKGAIALLLLCGSLFLTAGVLAYNSESPSGVFGIVTNPENILRPLGTFLGLETAVPTEPTVTTDRDDYRPGDIVQITGSGFMADETVRLLVIHIERTEASLVPHAGHEPWDVTADKNGNFTAEWLVQEDSFGQLLLLTADGRTSGLHAETTFTDSSVDFRQCSNENPTLGQCIWINSIVQSSNARYAEGMSNMQRVMFIDVGATGDNIHRMTMSHQSTKGGIHAYDFLTSYEQAIKAGADMGVPYTDTTAYTPLGDENPNVNLTLTNAQRLWRKHRPSGRSRCDLHKRPQRPQQV